MSYPARLFHLTLDVPKGTKRARSLCGYSLREGARFDTLAHYVGELGRKENAPIKIKWVNAFKRVRNGNTLMAFAREDYWEHFCPQCREHPEYALTLLADLP